MRLYCVSQHSWRATNELIHTLSALSTKSERQIERSERVVEELLFEYEKSLDNWNSYSNASRGIEMIWNVKVGVVFR